MRIAVGINLGNGLPIELEMNWEPSEAKDYNSLRTISVSPSSYCWGLGDAVAPWLPSICTYVLLPSIFSTASSSQDDSQKERALTLKNAHIYS